MSLVPAFEIGIWNAWILTVFLFLTVMLPGSLIKNKEAINRMQAYPPYSRFDKILADSTHNFIMPVAAVYSIFLPLKLGTVWLYVGLPICFLAGIMTIIMYINIANTPPDEPVTRGVYRISRNPIYFFGGFLMYIGIGLACASWVFLLFAVLWIVLWHIVLPAEERFLLEKYGDAYREYMNKTPRWIGMPKSGERE